MAFHPPQPGSILDQLLGHTATFLVDGRSTNLAFGRAMVSSFILSGHPCTIFDIDALYSSSSEYVFGRLSDEEVLSTEIVIPGPETLEDDIGNLAASSSNHSLIFDSLNSLYHLTSTESRRSGSRNIAFLTSFLSFLVRSQKRTVIFTMYRRENPSLAGGTRSIADLSDLTFDVHRTGDVLNFREKRGSSKNAGAFSVSIPP